MNRTFVKHLCLFVLLVLVQVFILQQLYFFYFVPLLYIYALMRWPVNMPVYQVLICGFLLGLSIDIFSDTLGMHAFATTMAGFVRLPLLRLTTGKNEWENIEPGGKSLGFAAFWGYAALLVVIHHTALFVVESFSFFEPWMLLLKILGSSLLTLVLVFFVERFHH